MQAKARKKKTTATFYNPSEAKISHEYTVLSTAGRRVRQKTVHTVDTPSPPPSDYSSLPYSSDSEDVPVNPTSDAQLTGVKVVGRAKRYTNSVSVVDYKLFHTSEMSLGFTPPLLDG